LLVFTLALGVYPRLVFGITNAAVDSLMSLL
jgi:NADH:ubiquinone oxidoreductase subunit 4 (subunit M)